MSASFPRLKAGVALLMALVASAATSVAQIPVASSARTIPTEVEQSDGRITLIISRAEDHFRKGKLNLEDNKRNQAREEVPLQQPNNAAVNTQLVAQNTQTQDQKTPPPSQVGFRDQKFEPSPLDELSKLVLTEREKEVSSEDLATLEQSQKNVNFTFTLNTLIQQFINFYQGRNRSTMENGLR